LKEKKKEEKKLNENPDEIEIWKYIKMPFNDTFYKKTNPFIKHPHKHLFTFFFSQIKIKKNSCFQLINTFLPSFSNEKKCEIFINLHQGILLK
jgi:hypothetical protein